MSRQQINKMTCAPSGDSDKPGHLPSLISSLSTIQFFIFQSYRNHSYIATHWVHSDDWSDCADTHVDLMPPWEPSHSVGFVTRWLSYGKNRLNQQADYLRTYWRSGSVTRASGLCLGGCGFNPLPSHTKDFHIGISCSFVCACHWESGIGQSGVSIMWLGGMSRHVMCPRCDMPVRQHSKSEHWPPCHIQTPSRYNWRLLKATLSLNKIIIIINKTFFFHVEICPMA